MVPNGQKGDFKCLQLHKWPYYFKKAEENKHQPITVWVLPEAYSVAQGCVPITIFSIDWRSVNQ